jgi:hypothetical protein
VRSKNHFFQGSVEDEKKFLRSCFENQCKTWSHVGPIQ